ncbi:MAG: DUF2283 domain-containing protein [Gemmatimonadetes bacterium]|nr:DUF2283 domain-containing protein [Gemmatimonadota bacterium]
MQRERRASRRNSPQNSRDLEPFTHRRGCPPLRRYDRPQRVFPEVPPGGGGFSDEIVDETREISENVCVDLDKDGNLVSMTIEHAAQVAQLPQVSLEEFGADAA